MRGREREADARMVSSGLKDAKSALEKIAKVGERRDGGERVACDCGRSMTIPGWTELSARLASLSERRMRPSQPIEVTELDFDRLEGMHQCLALFL